MLVKLIFVGVLGSLQVQGIGTIDSVLIQFGSFWHGECVCFVYVCIRQGLGILLQKIIYALVISWHVLQTFSEGYLNCLMSFRLKSDEAYEDAIVLRVIGGMREELLKVFYSDRELCVMQVSRWKFVDWINGDYALQ